MMGIKLRYKTRNPKRALEVMQLKRIICGFKNSRQVKCCQFSLIYRGQDEFFGVHIGWVYDFGNNLGCEGN